MAFGLGVVVLAALGAVAVLARQKRPPAPEPDVVVASAVADNGPEPLGASRVPNLQTLEERHRSPSGHLRILFAKDAAKVTDPGLRGRPEDASDEDA